ncbi:HNH endonuclease [Chloroflexota bacterium]
MVDTISSLIKEYFKQHPNKDLSHGVVVDWVTDKWLVNHDSPPRDPWRAIRKLHQEGFLIKVRQGIYQYDPSYVHNRELWNFSSSDKETILRRDGYKCVICGRGRHDGVTLAVDHIKPKDKGGTNSIDNGQTLCYEHNLQKKNYSQTESGKKYFIRLYIKANNLSDERTKRFCEAIFDVYDRFQIDKHIKRPDKSW